VSRISWQPVIERAAEIVESYASPITLRQLHYRLVSDVEFGYPNTQIAYSRLSHLTAQLRRDDEFPALEDLTRSITEYASWSSVADYLSDAPRRFRCDRTEGQETVPVVIAEKATLLSQLDEWFATPFGIPVIALRGYSSESLDREISDRFADGTDYAVVYVGDFDPSGLDIERNVRQYVDDLFIDWTRVAVTPEIIDTYHLPENPGKATDTRARSFAAEHGRLVQVEVEAIDPNDLRSLLQEAISPYWNDDAYQRVLDLEREQRAELQRLVERYA
jgi:hypothetical protein